MVYMKLTMVKKYKGKYRPSVVDWKTLIKSTNSINEVFSVMYEHKKEASYFVIEYGFNNTQVVDSEDLI